VVQREHRSSSLGLYTCATRLVVDHWEDPQAIWDSLDYYWIQHGDWKYYIGYYSMEY
jgi:hypothetical protein